MIELSKQWLGDEREERDQERTMSLDCNSGRLRSVRAKARGLILFDILFLFIWNVYLKLSDVFYFLFLIYLFILCFCLIYFQILFFRLYHMKEWEKEKMHLSIPQFNPFKWFNQRLLWLAMREPFHCLNATDLFIFFPSRYR